MPNRETKNDARNRSGRSALHGALSVAVVAVAGVVADQVTPGQIVDWVALGAASATAAGAAVAAYVHRLLDGDTPGPEPELAPESENKVETGSEKTPGSEHESAEGAP